MRGENDVLQISQGKVCRRGLDLENVERGGGHMLCAQSDSECGFVNEAATRAVDDPDPLLAESKPALIEHMARFIRQRHMQRKKIAQRQKLIDLLDEFDLKAARFAGGKVWVISEHAHSEGDGAPGDLRSNATHSKDA